MPALNARITEEQIRRLCQAIAEHFSPEKIILFGSYAYGIPRADSDVDLLVIMHHQERNTQVAMKIWQITQPNFPVDLIVRSPQEIDWRYREFDPLIRMAIDKGIKMYEQSHPRVAK
jgi:predicted nucleotidyltransferase